MKEENIISEDVKKAVIIKMKFQGYEILGDLFRREPTEKELNDFLNTMYAYANDWKSDRFEVRKNISFYLDSILPSYADKNKADSACQSYISAISHEIELVKKKPEVKERLKKMLRKEPTDEELTKYAENNLFLEENEPGINEPDCYVVFEAESRFKSFSGNRKEALKKAKTRYDRLSFSERLKIGNLFEPNWSEMEEDMAINEDFLNAIYNGIRKQMDVRFTLLSEEQVFGRKTIDVIRKIGPQCEASDLALLSECYCASNKAHVWSTLSSLEKDERDFGNYKRGVSTVSSKGTLFVQRANIEHAVRPIMSYSDISDISDSVVRGENGILEVEYGEYPQYAASPSLGKMFDRELSNGKLKTTGKTYQLEIGPKPVEEFEYDGKKYVRFIYSRRSDKVLSNGQKVGPQPFGMDYKYEYVWLEVLPIKWYVDEKSKLLISKTVLSSGVRFKRNSMEYDGDFEDTQMYMFLNGYFARDIIPSTVHEIKQEKNDIEDSNDLESKDEKIATYVMDEEEVLFSEYEDMEDEYIEDEKEAVLKKVRENPEIYRTIDGKYRKDPDVALEAVIMNGLLLEFVSEKLKYDEKIVKAALESNPMALQFASSLFKNDFDTVMYCVKRCGMALEFASPNMKRNPEIVLEAVKQDGRAIEFVDSELFRKKQNKNIVLEAAKNNGRILKFVKEFSDDRDVVLLSVRQNGLAIQFADKKFFDDDEIVLTVLSQPHCKHLIMFVSDRLKGDFEFMKKLCEIDRDYFKKYASGEVRDLLAMELLRSISDFLKSEDDTNNKRR